MSLKAIFGVVAAVAVVAVAVVAVVATDGAAIPMVMGAVTDAYYTLGAVVTVTGWKASNALSSIAQRSSVSAASIEEAAPNLEKQTENLSQKLLNGLKNSKNIIMRTNSEGEKVPYAKVLNVSDEYKLILRRDLGDFSHNMADHYNLELQTKAGNTKYNLHMFIDGEGTIIKLMD
jgi:hypothetical protein